MDPATAIGVASAAISFLDLTISVCRVFGQVVSSPDGATKQNAEIQKRLEMSKSLAEDLKAKRGQANRSQLGPDISKAVEDGIASSDDLLALLQQIKSSRDAKLTGPVKAVYKSFRYRERVRDLQQEVEKCRTMVAQGLAQATW